MHTSSLAQSIKILLLIVIIIGLFWMYNNKDASQTTDAGAEKIAPTITTNNSKPDVSEKVPSNHTLNDSAIIFDETNTVVEENVYTEEEAEFQMIDNTDPSESDLGGIDSIPTEEEREELMKFAPGADESGVIPEPPETGDIGVYGDAPEAGDSDIHAIAPEDSLAQ